MFKVKILYIPTGEFLRQFITGNTGSDIEWTQNPNTQSLEVLLTRLLRVNNNEFIQWRKYNNISLPLLIEELEVIYD